MIPKVYAVKHINDEVRKNSRSGGVFTAISDNILEDDGVVYGCILNEKFNAVHVRATTKDERDYMRGSKYIQSSLGDTFTSVKRDLLEQKKVLFTGTSCQIAGLQKYLRKEYSNLLCVDIVCHGVPSKLVWQDYLRWIEKTQQKKILSVNFRNKVDFGWNSHIETITFEDDSKYNSDIFGKIFYEHMILRPSCYECKYKSIYHPGDITIADYWGIDNACPEFNDNRGVSLVLINSLKGDDYFEKCKDSIICVKTRLEDSMQPPLEGPFPKPEGRADFWSEYRIKGFDLIVRKNKVKRNAFMKVCGRIKRIIKNIYRL